MISLGAMIKQLSGMVDTVDLTDWENDFVKNMLRQSEEGRRTSHLSPTRVERIEEIWRKHFAG